MKSTTHLLAALTLVVAHPDFMAQTLQIRSFENVADYGAYLLPRGSPPPAGKDKPGGNSPQRSRTEPPNQGQSSGGRSPFSFSFPPTRPSTSSSTPAPASSNPSQQPLQQPQRNNPSPGGASSSIARPTTARLNRELPRYKALVRESKLRAQIEPSGPHGSPEDVRRRRAEVMDSINDAEQKRARAKTQRHQSQESAREIMQNLKNPGQFLRGPSEDMLVKHADIAASAVDAAAAHKLGAAAAANKATQNSMFKEGADQYKKTFRSDSRQFVYGHRAAAIGSKAIYEHHKLVQAGAFSPDLGRTSNVPQARQRYKSDVRRLRKTLNTDGDYQDAFSGTSSSGESEGSGFSDVSN